VHLLGFDPLEPDSTDLRREPLERRKAAMGKLLRRSPAGTQLVEHFDEADAVSSEPIRSP
jgi:ATP-dependent DNA ligase